MHPFDTALFLVLNLCGCARTSTPVPDGAAPEPASIQPPQRPA